MDKINPEPNTGCWLWGACSGPQGYGKFSLSGKYIAAHRYSFLVSKGFLYDDKMILHKCDTPACVNPDHLYLGDIIENTRDCINRKRRHEQKMTHCKQGHELSMDNLIIKKDKRLKKGYRKRCKACDRKYWNKRKVQTIDNYSGTI